jgi:wyosine [tRNA(Phe)-imidazoG37] synthetase (radical SAM superfamily)
LDSRIAEIPYMLYADSRGNVYDHPYYRMAGFSGGRPVPIKQEDLVVMPEFSKLFYIPFGHPVGLDPATGESEVVTEVRSGGSRTRCYGVAAFLEPGLVRSLLPAAEYGSKGGTLPMWAYTAVGFKDGQYLVPAFRIEYNHKWDPRNYDDRKLLPAVRKYRERGASGPLLDHLVGCATDNHCFAAKNLFLGRWEAPLPVSRGCNANCLGCLSLQSEPTCTASHQRISFKPSMEEIVAIAVPHLDHAEEAIVSFGQGCEGEPLTEHTLIAESIMEMRKKTGKGTINLNTNGSWPDRIRELAQSGLDSIRISVNSVRPDFYRAYYRPKGYDFEDVVASIALSRDLDLYTMINYLVFPGISDQEEEIEALIGLIRKTGLNFVHLKNLCIDPRLYLQKMPKRNAAGVGMKKMVAILRQEFPDLELGYFNQPVKRPRAQREATAAKGKEPSQQRP